MSRRDDLEKDFPNLKRTQYTITSPVDPGYNCIAWAAGDIERFWWPDEHPMAYWPPGLPRRVEIDAFVAAFASLGYEACGGGQTERGYEKIALYADDKGVPKHAARQLASGRWTSKLGRLEDVNHQLYGLEGADYGGVVQYMRRRLGTS